MSIEEAREILQNLRQSGKAFYKVHNNGLPDLFSKTTDKQVCLKFVDWPRRSSLTYKELLALFVHMQDLTNSHIKLPDTSRVDAQTVITLEQGAWKLIEKDVLPRCILLSGVISFFELHCLLVYLKHTDLYTPEEINPPRVFNKFKMSSTDKGVYVGRPSKFGNPFVVGKLYTRQTAVERFEKFIEENPILKEAAINELKGKNLICFCAPLACHADILLKIANQ